MRVISLTVWAFVVVAVGARDVLAGPIDITVFNEAYSTTVELSLIGGGLPPVSDSRTSSGAAPLSDHMVHSTFGFSDATANTFGVVAEANVTSAPRGVFPSTGAGATSTIQFSPTTTSSASLSVDLLQNGSPAFTEVVVQLMNLTTSQLLWDIGWSFGDSAEWLAYRMLYFDSAPSLSMTFNSSDVYRLTLSARASGAGDSQAVALNVSGLHRVPEPATLSLLTVGVGLVAALRSSRRGMVRQAPSHRRLSLPQEPEDRPPAHSRGATP